jgi:AraC-like DNA-binding protein
MVLEEHLSIKDAAALFGCSQQYLRRLLGTDRLEGIKIVQV